MSRALLEGTFREVPKIQSRFLLNPDASPAAVSAFLSTVTASRIRPSHIEHGYLPDLGRRVTRREFPTGGVLLERTASGSMPLDQRYLAGITAKIQYRKEIGPEEFAEAWPQTDGRRVSKTRYPVAFPDHPPVLLDVLEDRPDMEEVMEGRPDLDGRGIVVVLFNSVAEAETYNAPDYPGRPEWLGMNVNDLASSRRIAEGRTFFLSDAVKVIT